MNEVAKRDPDTLEAFNKTPTFWITVRVDWSNEEEVRLVVARKQGGPIFEVGPDLLTRVILGEDMKEARHERD